MSESESKFVCPVHGEVKPKTLYYSCPLQGSCPECGAMMEDTSPDAGIKILSEEESRAKRPWMYEDEKMILVKLLREKKWFPTGPNVKE
tara:strand:- start:737 stop:1003 length:267 start_codon:yes stop_codon:yes gene_type:complete